MTNRKTALVLALTLLLAACASKITDANFQKVQDGMTEQQVKAILGAPTDSSAMAIGGLSGTSATWRSKDATITIQFVNGKVQFKQFKQGADKD